MRIPILGIHIVREKIFEDLEAEKRKAVEEQRYLNNGIMKNLLQHNANLMMKLFRNPKLNYRTKGSSLSQLKQKSFHKMMNPK